MRRHADRTLMDRFLTYISEHGSSLVILIICLAFTVQTVKLLVEASRWTSLHHDYTCTKHGDVLNSHFSTTYDRWYIVCKDGYTP